MVAGGAYAFTPTKKTVLRAVEEDGSVRRAGASGARKVQQKTGFMQRLEERWDKRRHEDW